MSRENGQSDLGVVWRRALETRLQRREILRYAALGTGVLGVGALGCGGGGERSRSDPATEATKTPKSGGSFRPWYQTSGDPAHFDPQLNQSITIQAIYSFVSHGLIKMSMAVDVPPTEIKIVPDLAEKWEQPDETTYVFPLRRGVQWHDLPPVNGRELDADDAVYTYRRYIENSFSMSWLFNDVDRIEARDKYTVVFRLKQPSANFLTNLAWRYSWIISREIVEKDGDLRKHNPVGMGPFMFVSHERNLKLLYKRNPNWFKKPLPYVDEVHYFSIQDDNAQKTAFLAGEFDAWGSRAPTDVEFIRQNFPTAKSETMLHPSIYGPLINVRRPPFGDKRIWKAISMAMDRKLMADTVYPGAGVINGIVTASMSDFVLSQDELWQLYKRDVPGAKRLLAEAGFPNGFQTTVSLTTGYGQYNVDLCEMFVASLRSAGIDAQIKMLDYPTFIKAKAEAGFDILFGGYTPYMDPGQLLEGHYLTGSGRNESGLSDPKLDDMIRRQKRALNLAERKKIIQDIERYIAQEANVIPPTIAFKLTEFVNPRVQGYRPRLAFGWPMDTVWIDK